MITPRSPSLSGVFCTIAAAARRIMLKVPIRLMRMVLSKASSGCGPFLPTVLLAVAMPAQLMMPDRRPSAWAAATTAWPSASEVTSQRTNWPFSSVARAWPACSLRSAMTTLAPASASILAVPAPRPEAPPVTMKTLSLICICGVSFVLVSISVYVNVNYCTGRGLLRKGVGPVRASGSC
ncbi:hypothetical protein D3C72_1717780 [compost metagenome]